MAKLQKTFTPTPADLNREWYVVDATGIPVGRLATRIATILRGKHKPTYAPHMDGGDFVIVLNADKVTLSGAKESAKMYYRHSGFPGGLSVESAAQVRASHPERIVEDAVRGMLPKNRLGRRLFTKLKVYSGGEHPHEAQQPKVLEINRKGDA